LDLVYYRQKTGLPGWDMVVDLNLGPHIHFELSGPSRELVIFFKISKIGGGSLWGALAQKLDLGPPIFFVI